MKNRVMRTRGAVTAFCITMLMSLGGAATASADGKAGYKSLVALPFQMAAAPAVVIERDAPVVVRERVVSQVELRAQALLTTAVEHVRNNGPEGAADFSRESAFVDRDLYAYALAMDGTLLGSGGWSAALVGQNVLKEADTHGELFFQRMIEMARQQDRGQIQYYWFNPGGPFDEPKVTDFVRQGDVIVAVGYYPPRTTRRQAQRTLRQAVAELETHPDRALDEFQDSGGEFITNDLYVFVVDLDTGTFVAHGASPSLLGSNAYALLDATGRNIVREMADVAKTRGHGELDYFWINPMNGRIESKHTYFRVLNNYLVATGSYN